MTRRIVYLPLGLLLIAVLLVCGVVAAPVGRAVILGERAGLQELKTEPLLEPPPPGSTELLRIEQVGRGCGLLVPIACVIADPASIKAFYASPLSVDEVREWYQTTHGARYGLGGSARSDLMQQLGAHKPEDRNWAGLVSIKSTTLDIAIPRYIREDADLRPVPANTKTVIQVSFGFNDL